MEIWRTIPSFPDYEASSLGRIRRVTGQSAGAVLKPYQFPSGYLFVGLRRDGQGATRGVNRVVLEAFVGPAPEGFEASHINGDKQDNRPANLVWETPKENCARRVAHGTSPVGEKNPRAKLVAEQVRAIRDRYARGGTSYPRLAKEYGVAFSLIHRIVKRKAWAHV